MVTVYLDACCLSRLTDDQSQDRVRDEAVAVEKVLALVRRGKVELVSSEALADEVRRIRSVEQRVETMTILSLAKVTLQIDAPIATRAYFLVASGYGPFDALHVAAAEAGGADVLLTTDDRLVRRATRGVATPRVSVKNPVSWLREQL